MMWVDLDADVDDAAQLQETMSRGSANQPFAVVADVVFSSPASFLLSNTQLTGFVV